MANTTIQPAPIRQAIFDASGNMTRAWVVYFQSLFASVANLSGSQATAATQLTTLASGMAGAVPKTRHILTQAPLTGGGDLSVDRTLAISNFQGDFGAGGLAGAVPAPHAGDAAAGKFLKAGGGWAVPATAASLAAVVEEAPSGALNGTNTAFTLTYTPSPSASLVLYLNGVEQIPGTGYTISANTIAYTVAPKAADLHLAWYTH